MCQCVCVTCGIFPVRAERRGPTLRLCVCEKHGTAFSYTNTHTHHPQSLPCLPNTPDPSKHLRNNTAAILQSQTSPSMTAQELKAHNSSNTTLQDTTQASNKLQICNAIRIMFLMPLTITHFKSTHQASLDQHNTPPPPPSSSPLMLSRPRQFLQEASKRIDKYRSIVCV